MDKSYMSPSIVLGSFIGYTNGKVSMRINLPAGSKAM